MSVRLWHLAQVMLSQFVGSSPASGSVLTTETGACLGSCVSLSLCPFPAHALSLSVSKINKNIKKYILSLRGTWVAQSVKYLTLDFSSGHDLMVCEFKP